MLAFTEKKKEFAFNFQLRNIDFHKRELAFNFQIKLLSSETMLP